MKASHLFTLAVNLTLAKAAVGSSTIKSLAPWDWTSATNKAFGMNLGGWLLLERSARSCLYKKQVLTTHITGG